MSVRFARPRAAPRRRPRAPSAAAVLALAALAVAGSVLASPAVDTAAPRWQARDDAGHTITLARPARRIVALAPHLVELAFAAGAGSSVVGVSRFSDYPPPARRLPVVGDAFNVDLEALARLHPDLVLVWGSGTAPRLKDRLRALGWPVYEVEVRDIDGLARTLRNLGDLAGTRPVADGAARAVLADWSALQARYAGQRPVRVFYQLWDAPLMTLSGQHLIGRAITACGGRNVFQDLPTLTATVSWEAAVQRDPELVVAATGPNEPATLGRWAKFPTLSATRHHQFAHIDADLIARSGPRFVEGARQLCEAIDRARRGLPQPPVATDAPH